ncbi:EpsG family protein [Porphyromonas pogonae]|uniref:EpsG family protein n=1 Tax=Porphyromonas pogonae TaxID=867595 RepID=UPI002E774ED4|nr:EpsG family protein [Porphyromonas pogonae]
MEYIYYIFLLIITLFFALMGYYTSKRRIDYFSFIILMGLSIIVRQNLHSDMIVYADTIKYIHLFELLDNGLYYVKEGLFWLTSAFLCQNIFGGHVEPVFYCWDAICFIILISIRNRLNLPYYFLPLYFIAFSGVFTFQNVYRQFIATCIFLYALSQSLTGGRYRYTIFLFFIATLIHNSALLFLGILPIIKTKSGLNMSKYIFMILAVIIILPFVAKTDYDFNTGLNLNLLYSLLILCLGLLIIFKLKFFKNNKGLNRIIIQYTLYIMLVSISSSAIMGTSLYVERISIYSLQLLIPVLCLIIEYNKSISSKISLRFFLIFLLSIPTFVFPATLSMLENSKWLFD